MKIYNAIDLQGTTGEVAYMLTIDWKYVEMALELGVTVTKIEFKSEYTYDDTQHVLNWARMMGVPYNYYSYGEED